jgi:crotonobetaine/carnitine-CoA ligase
VQTVFEAFMATAAAVPDQPFLCATPAPGRAYHPDGVELTYAAVRAEVLRLKATCAHAGYGPGHRIALLLANRP